MSLLCGLSQAPRGLIILVWMILASRNSAFLITAPKKLQTTTLRYFDDISRYSFVDQDEVYRRVQAKAADDKLQALEQLLGYSASSTPIDRSVVRSILKKWMRQSGAVGSRRGDELFRTCRGIKVCPSKDFIGCLAYFWRRIALTIADPPDSEHSVALVTFPYCSRLYSYQNMALFHAAMMLGQDLCLYVGSDLKLALFHPNYKNSPKLFSPERHAPFPTSGIIFGVSEKLILPQDDSAYVDAQRLQLERLFNSAAAGSDVAQQQATPRSDDEVISLTKEWFRTDQASRFALLIQQPEYFVSHATFPEQAYADVWTMMDQLSQTDNDWEVVLVAPRFCAYNAPQWRRFCITINAVLKKIQPHSTVTMQVFHPEYDQGKSGVDARRSPFPTFTIKM